MRFSLLLKRLLLGLLLLLLLFPAVQARFPLVPESELGGYAEEVPHPDFSLSGLFDNSYQAALARYVDSRIGLRGYLIQLRNQVAYSVFSVGKANSVLIGKDGVLIDETATRMYLGQRFVGDDVVRRNVRRLKTVQDTLARHHILLVFAIAPDKSNFFSEKFPAYFDRLPRSRSTYQAYAEQMQRQGVNLVDLAPLFRHWKDTARYPLFPRGGIHWSGYGATLAADTLARYIAQRGHLQLPRYRITGYDVEDQTRDSDDDVARALNLLVPQKPFRMLYPRVEFDEPLPGQPKPNLLLVGDSFGWTIESFYPYLPKLFNQQFWYYNHAVVQDNPTQPGGPPVERQLDRKAEILKQQVVLVLYSQYNLWVFTNGFVDDAYRDFCPPTAADEAGIRRLEAQLGQSTAVQDSLWKQAHNTNRDYNQLLHEMATREYELRK